MHIISDSTSLAVLSSRLSEKDVIAVDTEFIREKTYRSVLCLVQVAAEGLEAIIDPLAGGIDMQPFLAVMLDSRITKVFHAARQDLEIFHNLTGSVPSPVFDTQIAAMACGFGDQISYEALVHALLDTRIDKGSRFTDWARRPLSDRQLRYALSDVTHLLKVYHILKKNLEDRSRMHWIESETAALYNPDLYHVDPAHAWKRLKLRNIRKKTLGPLIALAEWREKEAQSRNVPRNRILKDDTLTELAHLRPENTKALSAARSLPAGTERSALAGALIDAVRKGMQIPEEDLPRIRPPVPAKPPAAIVELLKVLLKHQCASYGVAPRLLAGISDMEKIALHDSPDVPALKGWRYEIFGRQAINLKQGKTGMYIRNGKLVLSESCTDAPVPDKDTAQTGTTQS